MPSAKKHLTCLINLRYTLINTLRLQETTGQMQRHIGTFLFILTLPIAAEAEVEYTIPKKHRVIQEKSLQPSRVPVGSKLSEVSFRTLAGKPYQLDTLVTQGPVVFVFLAAECPVAQRYAMRLKRMHAEFSDAQVTFVGIYSNENDTLADVKAYIARAAYPFPIVKDSDGSFARRLGATMTPQAVVVDASGVLRYRGSIDDNRYVTRVKHAYLRDALGAVLSGNVVPVTETAAFGCTIHLPERQFAEEWAFGEPDWVSEMGIEYEIAPEGDTEYRHFIIPTNFDKDMYVQAIDFQAGDRQAVRNIITYLDVKGIERRLDAQDEKPGYATGRISPGFAAVGTLGTWAPGLTVSALPTGVGYLLPKGVDISLQVHYYYTNNPVGGISHPDVKHDRLRLGLYFSKTPETARLHMARLTVGEVSNPDTYQKLANAHWDEGVASYQFKTDAYVFAVLPHKHRIGQDMQVAAITPAGERIKMLQTQRGDFTWQDVYHYREPIFLPAGSRLEVGGVSNSDSAAIEKPLKTTTDQTSVCFFLYALASEFISR